MGVVYKARQVGLNRLVALKMLLAGAHASPDDRRRFRAEAEAIARLQHPNIVQVFEIGEHEGRQFLSLEYIDGGSLAESLRGRALSPAEAAGRVRTLARAVEAAHAAGVVHRDLKPGNVLLTGTGVPKISDFGLAKKLDEEFSRTYHGALLGTPAYMAPEQARGEPGDVGCAADVYALGAVLYECLTGQVPFRAATLPDLLDLVRHAEPVPPTRLNARLPRDLETITLKCLQKPSAGRYGSAAELADDLERYLDGRPIRARPVSVAERAFRWAKRHRALAALYAVSCVAVVALVGLGLWFSAHVGAARARQEALEARADRERERAVAAEGLAEARRFFGLLTQAREQIARPRPGWTWRALDDLARAARLPDARSRTFELRSEAASCLGGVDARLALTLDETPRVTSVAWHPSRRLVAVGNRGGGLLIPAVVHLIDLDSPKKRRSLFLRHQLGFNKDGRPGPDIVHALAFSPDGRRLVAGTRTGMLHIWDLGAGSDEPLSRHAHPAAIDRALFAPDGQSVYSLAGKTVKRFTLANLVEAASWTGGDLHRHLAAHPHEGWVAVCGEGKTQRLHPETLRPLGPPLATQGSQFAFTPDGRGLILAEGRELRAWDVAGDRRLQTLRALGKEFAHERSISDLAVSPDGTLLLSSADDTGHVRLWDLLSGQPAADLPHGAGAVKLAFAPDGRSFAVTGDNRVLVYEAGGRREQAVVARRPGVVAAFALAKDGSLACVTEGPRAEHGEVVLLPPGAGAAAPPERRWAFTPWHESQSYPLSYVGKTAPIAVLDAGPPSLLLADPSGPSPEVRASNPAEGRALARGPDGRLWGAVGDEVRSWDAAGKLTASWKNVYGITVRGVSAIRAVAAGRKWVVAPGQDGDVRVLPAGAGALKLAAARNLVRVSLSSVALSPDEGMAVVGSITGHLHVVAVPSAEVVAELPPMPDRVTALAWAENHLVACACQDGTVTLYRRNGSSFTPLLSLRHDRGVRAVQFHAGGTQLAVLLSGERGVRLWHLERLNARLTAMGLGF
jgi:WD40 repeat protein